MDGVLLIVLLLVALVLTGCGSAGYRPADPHRVGDLWQVRVRLNGLVTVDRQVELDAGLSLYLAGAAGLEQTRLFGSMDRQEGNECRLAGENPVRLHCTTAYRLVGLPSQTEATVPLPDDLLSTFLVEHLGYQPLALFINRQVVATLPGKILETPAEEMAYYPVYAWRSVEVEGVRGSTLTWHLETVLAPGDLADPGLQPMEPLVFQPVVGG